MSSIIFPDYEEINDEYITKRWVQGLKRICLGLSQMKVKLEEKVKIPSTPTTAFVQYTTEELDQLDQP